MTDIERSFWTLIENGEIDFALNLSREVCPRAYDLVVDWIWSARCEAKTRELSTQHNSIPIYIFNSFYRGFDTDFKHRKAWYSIKDGIVYAESHSNEAVLLLGHSEYVKQIGKGLEKHQYNKIKKAIHAYISYSRHYTKISYDEQLGRFVDDDLPF